MTHLPEIGSDDKMNETSPTQGKMENEVLSRIKILADLANAVQNEELKRIILGLPSGERLYTLFAESVSREIEGMMNSRNQAAPKEMLDALAVAAELKNIVTHTHAMMVEINRAPVMGVLGMLNQNLGGSSLHPYQPSDSGESAQKQPQQIRQQTPSRTPRGTGTGISY